MTTTTHTPQYRVGDRVAFDLYANDPEYRGTVVEVSARRMVVELEYTMTQTTFRRTSAKAEWVGVRSFYGAQPTNLRRIEG